MDEMRQIHMDHRSAVEKKGWHGHSLSERGHLNPCLGRLLLLFWVVTSKMVLIYYAQVHFRCLPFTDNQGNNAANYFREKNVADQGEKWLNWLHSILGRVSTDFGKLL